MARIRHGIAWFDEKGGSSTYLFWKKNELQWCLASLAHNRGPFSLEMKENEAVLDPGGAS